MPFLIPVAGTIIGGVLAGKGATAQAEAAEKSSAAAIAEQRRQFDITQRNVQPWLTAGTQALQTLQYLLGLGVAPAEATRVASQTTGISEQVLNARLAQLQRLSRSDMPWRYTEESFEPSTITAPAQSATTSTIPSGYSAGDFGSLMKDFSAADFQADPGYAFRMQESLKALQRSAAAKGTVLSGGTQREIARYAQDLASQEYQNAYNRFQANRATRFNQLASISGLGQTTATQLGQLGSESATNIGNLIVGGQTSAAAARASGYGAWGQAIQNATQIPLNWYLLSQLGSQSGGGAGSIWV
jgi:hypothetical protein